MTSPANAQSEYPARLRLALRRALALLQRHLFLLKASWPRFIELFFWPVLGMLITGYMSLYVSGKAASLSFLPSFLIGAVILWTFTARSATGMLVLLMEEYWSRNLAHLFVTPMRPLEYIVGLLCLCALRTGFAALLCALVAALVFDFNLLELGLPMAGFIFNLLMSGWWLGLLLLSMMLRFGQASEWLGWYGAFLMEPIVGVYYPVTVLPQWIQHVSRFLPPTYAFEGMRAVFAHEPLPGGLFWHAFALNAVYLVVGGAFFLLAFRRARVRGGLLNVGE